MYRVASDACRLPGGMRTYPPCDACQASDSELIERSIGCEGAGDKVLPEQRDALTRDIAQNVRERVGDPVAAPMVTHIAAARA
jgi:hypothetical protein